MWRFPQLEAVPLLSLCLALPHCSPRSRSSHPSSFYEALDNHILGLVMPHPATQHSCQLGGAGRRGRQMGTVSSSNFKGWANSNKAMSLSMVSRLKPLCRIMVVTCSSTGEVVKSLVPTLTLRSVGLVVQNQMKGRRGKEA